MLDCKELTARYYDEIKAEIEDKDLNPLLVIIQVGNNPASDIYVRNKIKACEKCNIKVEHICLPEDVKEYTLLEIINICNLHNSSTYNSISVGAIDFILKDKVSGIIVQMPLPGHIDPLKVCKAIDPNKDVDGFNPINVGKLLVGEDGFVPATVLGISKLLEELHPIEWYNGKNCVIIGRSNIVGKPMAIKMINDFNCTTTVCNSHTDESSLIWNIQSADIVICAVGKSNFLTSHHFFNCIHQPIVIDVGINRLENRKVVGDCDYEAVKDYCSYITPVPGSVGPMTICGLMMNVLKASK